MKQFVYECNGLRIGEKSTPPTRDIFATPLSADEMQKLRRPTNQWISLILSLIFCLVGTVSIVKYVDLPAGFIIECIFYGIILFAVVLKISLSVFDVILKVPDDALTDRFNNMNLGFCGLTLLDARKFYNPFESAGTDDFISNC